MLPATALQTTSADAAPAAAPATLEARPPSHHSSPRVGRLLALRSPMLRGNDVRAVQRLVGAHVDGIFGPKTAAGLRHWQGRHRLVRDGVFGPASTRAAGWTWTGGRTGGRHTVAQPASRTWTRASRSSSRTWVSTSGIRARIINAAMRYLGQSYSYGNLDCSGLTQRAYRAIGRQLPRMARDQQRVARHVARPQLGDLVFYGYPAYHVGIYAGRGVMVVARHTGTVVQEQKIWGHPSYGTVLT